MKITLLVLLMIAKYTYAYDPFDKMRCKGKLMSKGTKVETVLKYCGEPDYKDHRANQYTSYYRITYKSSGRGKYVMLFKNGYLIESKLKLYGAKKIEWQEPY